MMIAGCSVGISEPYTTILSVKIFCLFHFKWNVCIHMVHTLEYSPNMGLLVLFCFFFCCVNANFTIDQKMNESLRQVIIGLPLCDVCMMCKCVRIRFPRVKMFPYRMKCRVKKKEQRRNTLNNVKTWISCWTKNSKFKMDEWMDESK